MMLSHFKRFSYEKRGIREVGLRRNTDIVVFGRF